MNSNKQELIDAYLLGNMKDDKLNNFNEMLKQDPEMEKELKFQEEVMASIRDEKKLALRDALNKAHPDSGRRFIIQRYSKAAQLAAAVLVLALIVGGSFMYKSVFNSSSNSQQLFEEYFAPEYDLMTVRSITSSNTILHQGMNNFANQDYNKAIEAFEEIPDNMLGKLYSGFSHMHLENYGQAEEQFKNIIDDGESMFIDQAAWHLGLCYLASKKDDAALMVFNDIATGNTFYKTKSIELLTRMGSD